MDEDGEASPRGPPPKLRSAITGGSSSQSAPRKTKGRGFKEEGDADRNSNLKGRDFESLSSTGGRGPQRCQFLLATLISLSSVCLHTVRDLIVFIVDALGFIFQLVFLRFDGWKIELIPLRGFWSI